MAECKKKCEDFEGCNAIAKGKEGMYHEDNCKGYTLDKTKLANDDDSLFIGNALIDIYTLRGKQKSF